MFQRILLLSGILFLFSLLYGQPTSDQQKFRKGVLYLNIAPQFELPKVPSKDALHRLEQFPMLLQAAQQFKLSKLSCPFRTKTTTLQHTYKIHFDKTEQTAAFIRQLEQLPYVNYAERSPIYELFYTPNDIHPEQAWYIDSIRAEQAWDSTKGNSTVKIAVVDDAVDYDHTDLMDNIWQNPGETPGDSIDNDGNGYIDDVYGWDAADMDNNPQPPYVSEVFGVKLFTHGTHVSGIAASVTDNNNGVASIGFNCSIIPVKTITDSSAIPLGIEAPIEGVDYAITAGADVINMSWGGDSTQFSQTLYNLLRTADSMGIILVAAAGNSGNTNKYYPAALKEVIAVGATSKGDQIASFSNYGTWVDVMAPGDSIYSTMADTFYYGKESGTSMASPMVAGLCGLILSRDSLLTPAQVKSCLYSSCKNIDSLNPGYAGQLGAGRINAHAAVACAKDTTAQAIASTDQPSNLKLFPNPTPGVLHIQSLVPEQEKPLEITLYNSQGKRIKMYDKLPATINLIDQEAGLYFLRIQYKDKVTTRKVVRVE